VGLGPRFSCSRAPGLLLEQSGHQQPSDQRDRDGGDGARAGPAATRDPGGQDDCRMLMAGRERKVKAGPVPGALLVYAAKRGSMVQLHTASTLPDTAAMP